MGRQKKNELDAILEQLKRSYATDIDAELEDSLLEKEKSEEDAELASVLEKIFASVENDKDRESSENIVDPDISEFADDNETVEKIAEDKVDTITEEAETTVQIDEKSDVQSEEYESAVLDNEEEHIDCESDGSTYAPLDAPIEDDSDNVATDADLVDDVLNTMLRLSDRSVDVVPCSSDELDPSAVETFGNEDPPKVLEEDENDLDIEEINAEISYRFENDISADDLYDEEQMLFEEEGSIEDLENDDIENIEDYEDIEDGISEDEHPVEEPPSIVLDKVHYTPDELQSSLENMHFYKPENDLRIFYAGDDIPEDINSHDEVSVDSDSESVDGAEQMQDVSLLMKFGYGTDSGLGISEENVREVIVEKNKGFSPKKGKIIHGFMGKEFSSMSQKQSIIKKFKKDKTYLLIFSIIASLFAISMCILDFVSINVTLVDDYVKTTSIGIIFIIAVSALLYRRLYSGIINIFRSEYDPYSWVCFMHIGYVLYSILTVVLISESSVYFLRVQHFSLGGYVLIYTALTVWAEYIDCCRELDLFMTVSGDSEHYIVEKEVGTCHSMDKGKSDKTNRYSVRRTRIVSGFFRRISEASSYKTNCILFMSLILVFSVLYGVSLSIVTEDTLRGANSAILIFLATMPLSSAIIPSFAEYLNSIWLGKNNSAFIGSASVYEYSDIDSISLNSTDAVEVVSITEINPDNDSNNSKKWSNMATNIFIALGGPVSEYMSLQKHQDSNVEHDLIINSISENGIDLYFNSSVNVLLGDKQYMMSHNIKVKTDVKLTTAVKGSDRSVIYVAFDGVPRIGYIITGSIKASFADTLRRLYRNDIKTVINCYEPEINENYFEMNKIDIPLTVKKPSIYENMSPSEASDSGVVASSCSNLCRMIIYGSKIIKDRKQQKKHKIIQIAVGLFVSACIAALCNIFAGITPMIGMLVFYIASVLVLVPSIIHIVRMLKK